MLSDRIRAHRNRRGDESCCRSCRDATENDRIAAQLDHQIFRAPRDALDGAAGDRRAEIRNDAPAQRHSCRCARRRSFCPTAVRARIRRSDSTSGSSGIVVPIVECAAPAARSRTKCESDSARAVGSICARASASASCGDRFQAAGERVADHLARRGERRAHRFEHARFFIAMRRAILCAAKAQHLGIDLGPRMKAARGDAKVQIDIAIECGVDAEQRRIFGVAGARANPLRRLRAETSRRSREIRS